jgi:hypothetical protein
MIYLLIFIAELLILFLFSKALSQRLSMLFFRLSKSLKVTVNLLAFLFLPGTFLHEIAHYLMAMALFVKVGKMELIPKIEGEGKVKMGSVQIEKVDLIRSLIVGVAPLILGVAILLVSLYLNISSLIKGYIVFEIGNTMFSSRRDVEGGIKLVIALGLIILAAYLFGFRVSAETLANLFGDRQQGILRIGDMFLLVPLGIDGILLAFLSFLRLTSFLQIYH